MSSISAIDAASRRAYPRPMRLPFTFLVLLLTTTYALAGCATQADEGDPGRDDGALDEGGAKTSSAFTTTPLNVNCSLRRRGGTVTLDCPTVGYTRGLTWERLTVAPTSTSTTSTILGWTYPTFSVGVTFRDAAPGEAPVYQLRSASGVFLPTGAVALDGEHFTAGPDLGGAEPALPMVGCTAVRDSCLAESVTVVCTGAPGMWFNAFYDDYADVHFENVSGSMTVHMSAGSNSGMYIKDNFGPVTPAGARRRADGAFVMKPCFRRGPITRL